MKKPSPLKNLRLATTALLMTVSLHGRAAPVDDFFIAVRNDDAGRVIALMNQGVDVNSRDKSGQPALNVAMREHSPKVAEILVNAPGIDVNALNAVGESSLMLAAIKGDVPDAMLLLDHGADVNKAGWSPLHYAATGPSTRLVGMLLDRGAKIDALSPNGTTPLLMAAHYGPEDSVYLLVARGADLNHKNEQNLGVIDFARLSSRAPLVTSLQTLGKH